MKKIAIIGGKGMLSSQCIKTFAGEGYDLTIYRRSTLPEERLYPPNIKFADSKRLDGIDQHDYIINCAGVIKPFIKNESPREISSATMGNVIIPLFLAEDALEKNKSAKVIQIATDCVYSGARGKYVESDKHDATDAYGKTKSLGEMKHDRFFNLRCSIIGEEVLGAKNSLVEWLKNQPNKQTVPGYSNHYWNGLTTKAFCEICLNIAKNDLQVKNLQHVIPSDEVSKSRLLELLAARFRSDISVNKTFAPETIDRTLRTLYPSENLSLWPNGRAKSIEEMISEM